MAGWRGVKLSFDAQIFLHTDEDFQSIQQKILNSLEDIIDGFCDCNGNIPDLGEGSLWVKSRYFPYCAFQAGGFNVEVDYDIPGED